MKDKDQGVIIAQSAGFCPGVKKAIDCVFALEAAGKNPVYTIGPLIHNKQVTDNLEAKGITAIDTLAEAKNKNGVLVIRAHGITPNFQKEVEAQGMQVVDATCPLVKKAHNVIEKYAAQGYDTVIVGDAGHAEVIGLVGYSAGRAVVVATQEEARKLPPFEKVNIVAQTTQKEETFYSIAKIIKEKAKDCLISNTICEPTKQRQQETISLAKNADLVIVVGGKHSANTARLAKLCGELCPKVLHIESEEEINPAEILSPKRILITAGASTPSWVIEKVAAKIKGLRHKNKSIFGVFENFWAFLVNNSIYSALAAVCLTYVCINLQGAKENIFLYLLAGFSIFTLTLVNKDYSKNLKQNKKVYYALASGGALFAFLCSLHFNIYIILPTLLFLTLGIVYPLRYKLKLFINIPGIRDVLTALGWCFVCVYVPSSSQGLILRKSAWLALSYGVMLVFIRSVILSIGTEYKDIILGKESFYKAFGLMKTKIAITLIILALTGVLVNLLLIGYKRPLVAMLLAGHLYTIAIAVYFYSRKVPRTVASDTLIDGQFYLLMLLTFIAVNLF
ncbi:MAG: 4-hydroxy-3-methylbut-2-enyl diphosphate reductase [Elusimicrobiota bacterium]|jgi:4-hydroxy-3-methylbut-2-enyl diphosphate reductase|nr:4-hydroxy-3-methylbut-2-enyl diphosphate reductase [Elusimicrobiota bacterium]